LVWLFVLGTGPIGEDEPARSVVPEFGERKLVSVLRCEMVRGAAPRGLTELARTDSRVRGRAEPPRVMESRVVARGIAEFEVRARRDAPGVARDNVGTPLEVRVGAR
jgi:hypothetical protein